MRPWQQRAHLKSAYLALCGERLGFEGVAAAKGDRYVAQARQQIGAVDVASLTSMLQSAVSPRLFVDYLLADINNQSAAAERLVNPQCIFKWAQRNMSQQEARAQPVRGVRHRGVGFELPHTLRRDRRGRAGKEGEGKGGAGRRLGGGVGEGESARGCAGCPCVRYCA